MAYEWDPDHPDRLRLNGLSTHDEILAVCESSFTGKENFTDRVDIMKAWYRFAYPDHKAGHDTFQCIYESFCVTVLAGIFNQPLKDGPRLILEGDVATAELKNTLEGMERDGAWYSCSLLQSTLIHSQNVALLDRVIFRTQQGRIGLGPRATEPGDEIYLLGGASVPFILRPVDIQAGLHRLIGTSYIYGIMNGEFKGESGGGWVDLV